MKPAIIKDLEERILETSKAIMKTRDNMINRGNPNSIASLARTIVANFEQRERDIQILENIKIAFAQKETGIEE